MDRDAILRVRRLALAAQVAAGGPARPAQLARAGWTRSSSSASIDTADADAQAAPQASPRRPRPAAIETTSPDAEAQAGPLVRAFCEATGSRVPCEAWFVARGVRRITDQMQTRAAQRCAAASRPLRVTQEKD